MGTIVEKGDYLANTKSLLKEKINDLGGNIDNTTTFREYAQELQDIYDNIPKTTDTGTNLSLSTIKGKMEIIPKGNTQQTTYEGYNILQIKAQTLTQNGVTYTINSDGSIKINGTASGNSYCVLTNSNNSLSDYSTALFTMQSSFYQNPKKDTTSVQLLYRLTDGNYRNMDNVTGGEVGLVYLQVNNGVTINNLTIYPIIVNGSSTEKAWEPYVGGTASPNPTYPQPIEVVTGTQEVKVSGNEFAEIETQTLNDMKITKTDNGYVLNGTASANTTFRATITNPTNSNKTLCVKCDTAITNANVQVKTRSSDATQLRSISLSNANAWTIGSSGTGTFEDYYCDIYVKSGTTLSNVLVQPMLLEGTFTTSDLSKYQPYNEEQTQTISLGSIELCKIGTYQDYLYKSGDKWYKKEQIGKYNGKLTYGSSPYNSTYSRTQGFFDGGWVLSSNPSGLINYYSVVSSGSVNQTLNNGQSMLRQTTTDNKNTAYIWNTSITDNTTASTYFDNTTFNIYYQLATPIDTEITNSTLVEQLNNLEKLMSYNGTTNISSNGNLPIVLGVSALKGA